MNKDQDINELIDQIIDRQEAISKLLNDGDSMPEEMAEALRRIAGEQENIIGLLERVNGQKE